MGLRSQSMRFLDPRRPTDRGQSSTPSPTRRRGRLFLLFKGPSLSHRRRRTATTSTTSTSTMNSSPDSSVSVGSCSSRFLWLKLRLSTSSVMAQENYGSCPVRTDNGEKEKKGRDLHRKMGLEQEVEEFGRTLEHEEKVHQVLKRALQPNINEPTLHIPSFLPERTRELLAELVMVEGEVARLENEINVLRKESDQTSKSDQHKHTGGSLILSEPPLVSSIQDTLEKKDNQVQEKLVLETNMFFINQAIKGNHNLHAFTSEGVNGSLVGGRPSNQVNQRVSEPQGEVLRRNGVLDNSISPNIITAKHPLSKLLERESGASRSFRDGILFNLRSSQNNYNKLQPNKLSERIMKCLICIFLRLMRTSRKVERDDKSSTESRLANASLGCRIVRIDGNGFSPTEPRVMKQQDPYGIFKIDGTLSRDIGHYKNLIICTSNSLDVKAMSTCTPLIIKLRVLLNNLRDVDLRFLTHQQKLAFWINVYNTTIMHGFLEHGLPSDPEEVIALRNKVLLNVGGNELNALAIERFILRQSPDLEDVSWIGENDEKEVDAVRVMYGIDHLEPNVIFSLCCGNKSSPAVRIYTAEHISTELEKAKLEYLQASVVVTSTEKVMIPKLLHWHMNDFAKDLGSLVQWICNQLPTSGSLRKSTVACLSGQNSGHASKIVDILPHEFDFQFLLPI